MTWHIFLVECMIIYFDFGISFEIIRHKHHWTRNVGQFSNSVVDTPHENTQERIRRSVKRIIIFRKSPFFPSPFLEKFDRSFYKVGKVAFCQEINLILKNVQNKAISKGQVISEAIFLGLNSSKIRQKYSKDFSPGL